tara:strand:+ start:672 stop:896 length:225 start_codon:yes stop_codon:yes gene_type:complete
MNLENKSKKLSIGIIGSGAWGNAIVRNLCKNSNDIKIWCHESENAKEINTNHTNLYFLPDIFFGKKVALEALEY